MRLLSRRGVSWRASCKSLCVVGRPPVAVAVFSSSPFTFRASPSRSLACFLAAFTKRSSFWHRFPDSQPKVPAFYQCGFRPRRARRRARRGRYSGARPNFHLVWPCISIVMAMSSTPILHGLRGKLDAAALTPHCGALVTAMILLSLAGFLAVGISRDLDFLGSNINQSVAVQSLLQVGCVLACLPVISVAWRCASALEHFLPDLWTSLLGCSAFFDRSFRLSATRGRHRGGIAAAFRNAILLLLLLQPAVAAPKKSARRPQAPSVAGAASPVAASAPSAASLPSSPATPSTPPQPFQATAVVPLPSPPPPAVLPTPATAASAVHLAQQAAFLALARPLPPRPLPSAAPRRGPATTASAAAASAPS